MRNKIYNHSVDFHHHERIQDYRPFSNLLSHRSFVSNSKMREGIFHSSEFNLPPNRSSSQSQEKSQVYGALERRQKEMRI